MSADDDPSAAICITALDDLFLDAASAMFELMDSERKVRLTYVHNDKHYSVNKIDSTCRHHFVIQGPFSVVDKALRSLRRTPKRQQGSKAWVSNIQAAFSWLVRNDGEWSLPVAMYLNESSDGLVFRHTDEHEHTCVIEITHRSTIINIPSVCYNKLVWSATDDTFPEQGDSDLDSDSDGEPLAKRAKRQ